MDKLVWKKQGRIFNPEEHTTQWPYQYSQVPYALPIDDTTIRVYFTSRPPVASDGQFVSYTFYADFNNDLTEIKSLSKEPVMPLGALGTFDEFGTMPCSVIENKDIGEYWLYYVGWTRKVSVPYDCAIGLAISRDGGNSFERKFKGPLMSANRETPFLLGCPRVYKFAETWYMYYLAATEWVPSGNKAESIYHLKLAVSTNGLDWNVVNDNLIEKNDPLECQTCASVFEKQGRYHMYFTYRHGVDFRNPERGYRIGYAYSNDLIKWERNDELGGISVSDEGWDSEMICYPYVLTLNQRKIMFHCGNYFGKTGFGYLLLQE